MALRLSEVEEVLFPNGQTLASWLKEYKFFAGKRVHVVINGSDRLLLRLYTQRNCYTILAKEDYLGCTAFRRVFRPGEDWLRGNDLPDGNFSHETLEQILGAIVFYEALEVAKDEEEIEV